MWSESEWNLTSLQVVSVGSFQEQREPLKTKLVLFSPFEMFQTEIRVPFFKATVFDTSFRFSLLYFLLMELICANA